MGAPNHCAGRQISAGGPEKSQQFHNYFLQCSKFPSERTQVRTLGRQTCFLPRAQSNLVTPLLQFSFHPKHSLHSLQYLTTNLTFKILHSYHNQCARKTRKRFSTTASSKPKNIPKSCTSSP